MKSDLTRNLYMLEGPLSQHGYDWWWHNFTAYHRETGAAKAFFIEYYICNPALGGDKPILGQLPEHQLKGIKPSYAMIKVGTWGSDARQLHNFYGMNDFKVNGESLNLTIGACTLTETEMKGSCKVTFSEAAEHPEMMSDAGEMSWELKIDKRIPYHVGYGASPFFRKFNAFEMFWHAEGIKTEYQGEVIYNGEIYDVIPEKSYGYADKNWGKDFTSPWLWISSCNMKSLITGKTLENSAVEFGGGRPKAFGLDLGRKLLGCLYYEGQYYDFNFSKFWLRSKIAFEFKEGETEHTWTLKAKNRYSELELELRCPKDEMLLINYEAPDGQKRHQRLWNGGTGVGEMKLYFKNMGQRYLIDHIAFSNTGCEYGEYER